MATKGLTAKEMRGGVDKRGAKETAGITGMGGGGSIGNTPHVPTDEQRNKVRLLTALGNNQEVIAFAMDLSVDTLKRHYDRELKLGKLELNAQVGAAIVGSALGEKVPCVECSDERPGYRQDGKKCPTCNATGTVWRMQPNPTAQVWYSKNRMGWTDKEKMEGDSGGGPVLTEQKSSLEEVQRRLASIRERQKLLGN